VLIRRFQVPASGVLTPSLRWPVNTGSLLIEGEQASDAVLVF
jgi:hypothetical protein